MTRIHRRARTVAVVLVFGAIGVAVGLAGCGSLLGDWCASPPTPESVKTAGVHDTTRLEAMPAVVKVVPRYFQPEDKHCPSKAYLETAPWATDFRVTMAANATPDQLTKVKREATGQVAFQVKASAHHAGWSLPNGADLPDDAARAQEIAALPHVTHASVEGYSGTAYIQVDTVASVPKFISENPAVIAASPVSLSVPNRINVHAGDGGFPGPLVAPLAVLAKKHPRASLTADNDSQVTGWAPTRADARQLEAALVGRAFAWDAPITFDIMAGSDATWRLDGTLGQPNSVR